MLAIIFTQKTTGIEALIFLSRTFKSYKENVFFLHLLKLDRNLLNNAAFL